MKQTSFVLASALLIAVAVHPASAASRTTAVQGRDTLRQIEGAAANLGDVAFTLRLKADDTQHDRDSQLAGLLALRENVNRIGGELKALEADRTSLAPWEVDAISRVTPLMHQIAMDLTKAIETIDSDGSHLWATSYGKQMTEIGNDAEKVASILKDHLQLAKARDRERKLEHELGSPAGM